jgi:hypothetical protein
MELITQILTNPVTINAIITLVSIVIVYAVQKYLKMQILQEKVQLYISKTLN